MSTALRAPSFPLPSSPRRRNAPTTTAISFRRCRLIGASSAASGDEAVVDVIGIGSRKDALIDFCLGSSLSGSSRRLRFWTIHTRDSKKVQLLQRCHGTDATMKNLEFPLSRDAPPPSVILVASAGHGLDHATASEILNAVKLRGGLTAAILLKPFSFEGRRRQEEVHDIINQLREQAHFYIVVEADILLNAEAETLAGTLEGANNAVFLAISTISVLMSENYLMFLNIQDEQMSEIKPCEVLKLLESHGETKIGFGAGYSIKAAIIQAVFHCPFLTGSIKDTNGPVIFTLASTCTLDLGDLLSVIRIFRRVTGYTGEVIFSRIHEPDLEPNLVVTTLLVAGCSETMVDSKVHSPSQSSSDLSTSSGLSGSANISNPELAGGAPNSTHVYNEEMEPKKLRNEPSFQNKSSAISPEVSQHEDVQGRTQREEAIFWNMGPGINIAQLWAKERASVAGANKIEKQDIFTVPAGVKSSETYGDHSTDLGHIMTKTSDDIGGKLSYSSKNYGDEFADACLSTVMDIYNSALTILKGRNADEGRKLGGVSLRATSMLEAERKLQKSWTPLTEMVYRGGTYRGRCQGGLPEGKGLLTNIDGSFYDGMWRYGKRSGLGTFCYSNGDVFQGSWRDDLMHGKGWFYFHTGDRWFANFWKGKANGEGRFYSKNGSIFFGNFEDGWRHGRGLWIDVDGSRWTEVWDEGVLVKRTEVDS